VCFGYRKGLRTGKKKCLFKRLIHACINTQRMNMNNDQGKHCYTNGSIDESLKCTEGKTIEDRTKAKEENAMDMFQE
jgi:hypothetical protein